MRKLYAEYFHIPKQGKINEKVMLMRVTFMVSVVIMCLAAMSFTAYAYFSYNVTSGSNIIQAANFKAKVSITNNSDSSSVSLTENGLEQEVDNLPAGTYTVKLEKGDSTASTGFCIITLQKKSDTSSSLTVYTQQLGTDVNAENGKRDTTGFTLQINEAVKLVVQSHWGTSSSYIVSTYSTSDDNYIENGDTIEFGEASEESSSGGETTKTEEENASNEQSKGEGASNEQPDKGSNSKGDSNGENVTGNNPVKTPSKDTESVPENGTETESKAESETESASKTESKVESEVASKTESEAETGTEFETESKVESEVASKTESEAESGIESMAESESESGTQSETDPVVSNGTNSETNALDDSGTQ